MDFGERAGYLRALRTPFDRTRVISVRVTAMLWNKGIDKLLEELFLNNR